jgi:hypothetical protein
VWKDGALLGSLTVTAQKLPANWLTATKISTVQINNGYPTITPAGGIQDLAVFLTRSSSTSVATFASRLWAVGHSTGWSATALPTKRLDACNVLKALLVGGGVRQTNINTTVGLSLVTIKRSITPGTTTMMSVIQIVMASEQGALFQLGTSSTIPGTIFIYNRHKCIGLTTTTSKATFANTPSLSVLPYLLTVAPTKTDLTVWNSIPTKNSGTSTTYLASTPDSIALFTRRSLQGYTALVYKNIVTVQSLGQWLLGNYAEPLSRLKQLSTSSILKTGITIYYQGSLRFLTLVQVAYYPLGYNPTSINPAVFFQKSQIEHVSHKIIPGVQWDTTYILTPYYVSTRTYLRTARTNSPTAGTPKTKNAELGGYNSPTVQNRLAF